MDTFFIWFLTAFLAVVAMMIFVIRKTRGTGYVRGSRYFDRKTVTLNFPEGKLQYRYRAAIHGRTAGEQIPPFFEISREAPSKGMFALIAADDSDRFHQKWGTTKPAPLRLPGVDDKYFVITPFPDETRRYLSDSRVREPFRALEAQAFTEFRHCGKTLRVRCTPFRGNLEEESLPNFSQTAKHLAVLATFLPQAYAHSDAGRSKRHAAILTFSQMRFVALALAIPLIACFLFALDQSTRYPALRWREMWQFAGPALLFLIGVLYTAVRAFGRAYQARGQALTLLLTFGSLMAGALSWGGVALVNGEMGSQSVQVHRARVTERRKTRRKSGYDYYFRIESWRAGETDLPISVGVVDYERYANSPELVMNIEVHDGALGIEWSRRHEIQAISVPK